MSCDNGGWKLHVENPDIDFLAPKSGALWWIDTFAIPAKAKNVDAAYKWINFMLRPENAAEFTNLEKYGTASKGAIELTNPTPVTTVLEEIMSDTQDSGIGSERWAKDSDEGADSDRGGKKALLTSEPAKPVSQENRPQLEVRIEALEARLEDYTKELREALKVLLHKERSRNDKLLMAYAQLKTKYDALKEELTHPDRPPAGARENGNTVKPLQGEKRFTLVSDSENKDRQR